MAVDAVDRRPAAIGSGSPAATRSCSSTRSRPVHLGHRVLDLQAGVDLEEVDRAVVADEELDGAGALVADVAGERERAVAQRLRGSSSEMLGDGVSSMIFWLRRWIEHSRSPKWTTLPCRSPMICTSTWRPCSMYGSMNTRAVAERRLRLACRRLDGRGELGLVAHDAHPPAAAAGRRLHEHRHRETGRHRARRGVVDRRGRHARFDRRLLRRHLVAEQRDLIGRRPDPDQPGVDHRPGERRRSRRGSRSRGGPRRHPVSSAACSTASPRRYDSAGLDPPSATARSTRVDVQRVAVGLGVHADRLDAHLAGGRARSARRSRRGWR